MLRILLAIALILAALAFAAFYRGLVIRQYEVASAKYPAGEAIKIVLLADLHSYIYKPDQEPVIRRVKDLNPDVILLCGEIGRAHV